MKQYSDSVIVVPWDFSNHSKSALDFALREFPETNIRVLCVLEKPDPYISGFVPPTDAEEIAKKHCVEQFESEQNTEEFPGLQFVALFGDPATEIVQFASQFDASMIVISTHGRTGLSRLAMGSVTEKVVRQADSPILIVPYSEVPT